MERLKRQGESLSQGGAKLRWALAQLNVEPVILLYSTALGLYITFYQDFIKWKLCVEQVGPEKKDSAAFCFHLSQSGNCSDGADPLRTSVQSEAAQFGIYYQLVLNIPALPAAIVLGAWSERGGRKLPLLLSLSGNVFGSLTGLAVAIWTELSIWLYLSGVLVSALFGSFLISFMAAFAMIADEASEGKDRTIRIGIGSAFLTTGMLIGSLTTGAILRATGSHIYAMLAYQAALTAAFVYCALFVRESVEVREGEGSALQRTKELVLGSAKSLCRPREGKRRACLNVALLVFFLFFASDVGMPGLQVLFLECVMGWTDAQFSDWTALAMAASSLSMALLPPIAKRFGFPDASIILFGILFTSLRTLLFALAGPATQWMTYLSATLSLAGAVAYPCFRSFVCAQVDPSEFGRVFAVITVVENLAPILSGLVFNTMYWDLLNTYPNAPFLLAAALQLSLLVPIGWVCWASRGGSGASSVQEDKERLEEAPSPVSSDDSADWRAFASADR